MEFKDYLEILSKKKQTLLSAVFVFLVLAFIITFLTPFRYATDSKLLVVQQFPSEIDPYSISRSNEFLGATLARVVNSNSFFQETLNSGYNIDKDYFSGTSLKQLKKWNNSVYANAINDTGIISIRVLHEDRYQADQIANAINYILKNKHGQYHGSPETTVIKIIDSPITSNMPVSPNIVMNIIFAVILGLMFGMTYAYLFPDEKHNINILKVKRKKTSLVDKQKLKKEKAMRKLLKKRGMIDSSLERQMSMGQKKEDQIKFNDNEIYTEEKTVHENMEEGYYMDEEDESDKYIVEEKYENKNTEKDDLGYDDFSKKGKIDNVL